MAAAASTATGRKRILRGVVFDMDGTLTVPCIDFADMRRRIGVSSHDILHEIEGWEPARQEAAYKVITEIEMEAQANLKIMPGMHEICSFLDERRISRGLITRNVKASVDYFHSRAGVPQFSPALSREFLPYKPSPGPLLHICGAWGVPPHEVLMVGDSAKDDVVCGNRAGASTCLLDSTDFYADSELPGEQAPTFVAKSLSDVKSLIESQFELLPTNSTGGQ